jgi:hypothetical protein
MLDLRLSPSQKGIHFTKILLLNLIVIASFLFLVPVNFDTYMGSGFYWSWNQYLSPFYLYDEFDRNGAIAIFASIIRIVPDIINIILAIIGFATAMKHNKLGQIKEIFHSNKVLAAVYYGLAASIFSTINQLIYLDIWVLLYPLSTTRSFFEISTLMYFMLVLAHAIPVIISMYLAILTWKMSRYL